LQSVFAAVGKAVGKKRLGPETLHSVATGHGCIVADHQVSISHVSGKEAGYKRGHYVIFVAGPRVDGRWRFGSGELEKLSKAAALNCLAD
jgi:hypothetical protein